jgi:DNA-binding MarR family transcriptional regulator
MKIKKELGVDGFRNIWEKTQMNLEYTFKKNEAHAKEVLSKHGITFQQLRFLIILDKVGAPCNLKTIKEQLLDKNADVSRLANRIIQKGWAEKVSEKQDRRNTLLELSESGMAILKNALPDLRLVDRFFYNLSKKDAKQLNSLLDKIRED